MTSTPPLGIDVYVAPMRPFQGPPGADGDQPMWSPMSSTLISGVREAILVDTLITFDQVDELAKWARGFGKRITGVYITHGHSDHWIGLGRLQEHFPEAKGFATAEVVERARYEANDPALQKYWNGCFPAEIPEHPILPGTLADASFEIEGHLLRAVSVGQGDTEHSTVLHIPSASAVVGGDVVYNQVHMMTAETDAAGREAWIASLDAVAALEPSIVVAGHKRVGASDGPENIEASRQYLRDFSRIVDSGAGVDETVAAMLDIHGDRDNPRTLWYSTRMAVSKRSATPSR